MGDIITVLFLLLMVASEALLWLRNPLHVPSGFFPARAFGWQRFQELGPSMQPTLLAGHHVLISSWAYWKDPPRLGDVIAFTYPRNRSFADLKRIVAIGGSTVEIRHGVIYIDDKEKENVRYPLSMRTVHVPINAYFVLGDNPEQSEDSRSYGPIERNSIIGKQWP